ncbi:Qat anti-phage system TatD family nuclease QatD [Cyclobacterium plantarum]|uniref:Qat anti-phage system TatD family nuclease QatD n=1 Tax=Cyclobacterium plantarum TaxID=2716263 RepID=UPI003F71CDE2
MIDLHCHLDLYKEPKKIIDECKRRNLYVLSVTTTPSAWVKTNQLADGYSKIRTALGLHPQLAKERISELNIFDEIFDLTGYIGEIGLDGSKENLPFWDTQVSVFHHILKKCAESTQKKVLSIHSRNASREVLDSIGKFSDVGNIIMHWFSGDMKSLDVATSHGVWFSINPAMLSSKKGSAIISQIPRNKILLESDGPFSTLNGSPLYPWDAENAIYGISKIWGWLPEQVKKQVMLNFKDVVTSNPANT